MIMLIKKEQFTTAVSALIEELTYYFLCIYH